MLASALPEESPVFDESLNSNHIANNAQKDKAAEADVKAAWETEADAVDHSILILPGVKDMIECMPDGRYKAIEQS
ncbi:hypothetical protein DFH11DRAFT_1734182 [Phellopilus nigrolimitatus]|nr:hypothetical protein DFH11DRAFT_1734182 [Phellopilus nigrolimitatus]